MTDRSTDNLAERLIIREERTRAAAQVVEAAVRRHKEMGKSIAVWQDGQVVIVPAEEIVLAEDIPSETEPRVRELVKTLQGNPLLNASSVREE